MAQCVRRNDLRCQLNLSDVRAAVVLNGIFIDRSSRQFRRMEISDVALLHYYAHVYHNRQVRHTL